MIASSIRSSALCLLTLSALICFEGSYADADDTHYDNFRFGQTAMGFGGAVIGFLSEPEASFYNPSGLAFLTTSKFSGAINFLGRDQRVIRGFASSGDPDIKAQDGRSQDLLTLPASSVLVKSFARGKHFVAFSTFRLSEIRDRFSAQIKIDDDDERLRLGYIEEVEDRIILIGPSYALRLSPNFSVGVSVFYARRYYSSVDQFTERVIRPDLDDIPVGYFEVNERVSTQDGALLIKLGAMWRVNSRWSVGASLSTPAIQLYGEGEYSFRYIDATPSDLFDEDDDDIERFYEETTQGSSVTQYPLTFGVGASYGKLNVWRLAFSVNAYMPLRYSRLELDETDEDAGGFTNFVTQVERELTINAALGGELYLYPQWPLRMGLFTNHASSPELTQPEASTPQLSHVDLYGGSLSLGYEHQQASINIGVEAQLGEGYEMTISPELDVDVGETFLRHRREQYRVIFFISGALKFVSNRAQKLIKID